MKGREIVGFDMDDVLVVGVVTINAEVEKGGVEAVQLGRVDQ